MAKSIIKSFSYPVDFVKEVDEFGKIAKKEGKSESELILWLMCEHVKKHGNGNPQYTIEQFQDPMLKAFPAFMVEPSTWTGYLMKLQQSGREKDILEIMQQASHIRDTANKIYQHGTHLVY